MKVPDVSNIKMSQSYGHFELLGSLGAQLFEMTICEKWCVLLGLFTVALVNIHSQGYSEFKDMENLFDLIHYHHVRFQPCHTQLRGDSSPSRCFPARQITVNLEFALVHISHNEIDQIIVSPGVSI